MVKKGNWGTKMVIKVPIQYKRVSYATCLNYSHEDYACLVTPIVPREDGFDHWKICKKFELSPEYHDERHKAQVIREKGKKFLSHKDLTAESKTEKGKIASKETPVLAVQTLDPAKIERAPKTFAEKFLFVAQKKHDLSFREIMIPEFLTMKHSRCFVNNNSKIVVITLPKLKEKHGHAKANKEFFKINQWSCFSKSLKSIIRILHELQDAEEFEKWIVIPVLPYKDDESYGEIFYRTKGKELKGIKLVEMDEEGELLFATGPIFDKFWTVEKIKISQFSKNRFSGERNGRFSPI